MPTYGYEIKAVQPGFEGRAVLRKEFQAADRKIARMLLDGWLAVEGYAEDGTDVLLITDGMTFLESGKRRITDYAAKLLREFGGHVTGPYEIGYDDAPGYGIRLVMTNGYGVSLVTGGTAADDPAPIVGWMTVREGGGESRYEGFRGAMWGTARGTLDGEGDLDRIRATVRELPQP